MYSGIGAQPQRSELRQAYGTPQSGNTDAPLATHHLLTKGDDMAVSKHTRASGCETNPFFLDLFRDHSESDERERQWYTAMAHAGEGTPSLRFPVYECLYLINVHSQKLIDLLDDASNRFGVEHESLVYFQSLIQCVRAGASQDIVAFMNDVELTEEWLFERLRANEEGKFRDPADAYLEIRRQETERVEKGLPPRIQFLDDLKSGSSPQTTEPSAATPDPGERR